MRLAVLSDIHLGADPRVDEFGHEPEVFVQFLSTVEDQCDQIILNGDVLEGLRGKKLGQTAQRNEVFAAAARYDDLLRRLQGTKYNWLSGNHDPSIAELGIPQHRLMHIDGSVLLFEHGHQFDRIEKLAPGLSPLVNWYNAWMNRWTGRDADEGLYELEAWLLGLRDDPNADHFQRKAMKAALFDEADVIVVGHTHKGGVWKHPEAIYANSGTCSLGRLEWLTIDTEIQSISFHQGCPRKHPVSTEYWGGGSCIA